MINLDKKGYRVNVYDFVNADTLEEGDQILYENDPIEVQGLIDSGDSIMVKGYSHLTGDSVIYILSPSTEVGLWSV